MKRTKVNSSNIHSHSHGPEGLEVVFHALTCPRRAKGADAETKCNCDGNGGHYHYPTVTAEEYAAFCADASAGAHFMKHIRNAKGTDGKPKHPATFIPAGALEEPA